MNIVASLENQVAKIMTRLRGNSFITNKKLQKFALAELVVIALVVLLNFLQELFPKLVCALTIVYVQLILILQAPKLIS
jgi:hypothetical protein